MTKQKTSNVQKQATVIAARKEANGYMLTTPTNREQRRDMARALKRSNK